MGGNVFCVATIFGILGGFPKQVYNINPPCPFAHPMLYRPSHDGWDCVLQLSLEQGQAVSTTAD